MKESVFDVLVYLFENYIDVDGEPADQDSVRDELQQVGFPEVEIGKAFEWLEGLTRQQDRLSARTAAAQSMRLFTEQEQGRMGVEGQGFVLFLEQAEILDPIARELVIDRFMALETVDASLEQLKWVVLMVLFNRPGSEAAYAWMEDLVYDNYGDYLH